MATATAAPPAENNVQPVITEKVGFFRRLGRKIKSGARRAWSWLKRAGKATGRTLWAGAKGVVKGAEKLAVGGVYLFLQGVGILLSAAIVVATFVAFLALAALAFVAAFVIGTVAWLVGLFKTYVIGFMSWRNYNTSNPLQKVSLREYMLAAKLDREHRVSKWSEWTNQVFHDLTDPLYEDIVVVDEEPESTHDRKVLSSLSEQSALRVQADLDNEKESFPGARVSQVATEDPYSAKGSIYEPDNPILLTIGRWLENHPDKTQVDFKFENLWPLNEQLEALEQLVGTANTKEERSFWFGRLQAVLRHPDYQGLDDNGRSWALVFTQYRHDQRYRMKEVRTGFSAMISDLIQQRDSRERVQARANN